MRHVRHYRLRVSKSSLPVPEAATDLICRFNLNGTYYVCNHARRTNTQDANLRSQDNHYVVFCPRYYNSPSLSQALSIADALLAPKSFLKAVAEDFVGNKGEVYFHESLVCNQA